MEVCSACDWQQVGMREEGDFVAAHGLRRPYVTAEKRHCRQRRQRQSSLRQCRPLC